MNTLFENINRSDKNIARYQTSTFDYFNSTDRDEFSHIRATLESWYTNFPKTQESEFLGRFRSPNNQHHRGALLELFTHRLFESYGYKLDRLENAYDFIATQANKKIALECTLARDPLVNEYLENHINLICDNLDVLKSKYYINLSVKKFNEDSPAHGKLLRWTENILKAVNHLDIENEINNNKFTTWNFKSNEWEIEVSLIPKNNQSEDSRNIGIISPGTGRFIDSAKHICDAVQDKKPSRYNIFNHPYIIVVNSLDLTLDKDSIIQSLFKHRNLEYGYFGNSINPKNSSVSGILIIKSLHTSSIFNPILEYWENPWAKFPMDLPFNKQILQTEEPYFQFKFEENTTIKQVQEKMLNGC